MELGPNAEDWAFAWKIRWVFDVADFGVGWQPNSDKDAPPNASKERAGVGLQDAARLDYLTFHVIFCAPRFFNDFRLMYIDIGNSLCPVAVSNRKITSSHFNASARGFQLTTSNIHLLVGRGINPNFNIFVCTCLIHFFILSNKMYCFLPRHKDDLWYSCYTVLWVECDHR